jgi:hypothetical protein
MTRCNSSEARTAAPAGASSQLRNKPRQKEQKVVKPQRPCPKAEKHRPVESAPPSSIRFRAKRAHFSLLRFSHRNTAANATGHMQSRHCYLGRMSSPGAAVRSHAKLFFVITVIVGPFFLPQALLETTDRDCAVILSVQRGGFRSGIGWPGPGSDRPWSSEVRLLW